MNIKYIISWVVVLGLIVGGIVIYGQQQNAKLTGPSIYDSFAQCVAKTGLTMYGAVWCPHCKAEKARFGSAFQFIPYVECPDNIKLCTDKGVTGYPTWIAADGTKYVGEQGLEKIAEISKCELPSTTK